MEIKNVAPVFELAFNETCIGWTNKKELNMCFIKHQEHHANDCLKTRGYLFVNEVCDMFGIPRTAAGQIYGWVFDEKCTTDKIKFEVFDSDAGLTLVPQNLDGNILGYL